MATSKAQQIGIWIIAITMTVGTIGSFLIMILANDNQKSVQAEFSKLSAEYQTQLTTQETQLSSQYFTALKAYETRPAAFNKNDVTTLTTEDLKLGDGADITAESSFSAYYIGWNPDGKVFDQSIDGDKLKAPFDVTPGGVITGWTEGAVGMKVGGVRELTIPSEKAYGETGSGNDIPANTPIKFVVMIVPTPTPVQPSARLIELYKEING